MIAEKIATWQARHARWALLPTRFIIGYGFAAHGLAKLQRGPEGFAQVLAGMGVPAPLIMSWSTTLLELVGGVAILAGLAVVPLAFPLAATMLTALFSVHLQYGFSSIKLLAVTPEGAKFGPPGIEVTLLYLAGLATLVVGGAGPFSVDGWLARRSLRRTW